MIQRLSALAGLLALAAGGVPSATVPQTARRNVVIFVADGLRHGSVNERDTPALWAIRQRGVHFENSHAVYPTSTTPNASVIATGHGLGDTGNFNNAIWTGTAAFEAGSFNLLPASAVPFIEDDRVLADLDAQFGGNYLGADTLLAVARGKGYRTAAIGKTGPTAIQDISAIAPENHLFPRALPGILIDDATGTIGGVAWPSNLNPGSLAPAAPTRSNGYGPTSPFNNGFTGDRATPGTRMANLVQQEWFDAVATDVVLPSLASDAATPFVFLYWSRDPDGTQHNQGDSLGSLVPGVNGETSRQGVRNADRSLQRLMAWLDAHPAVKANTNVMVTSDHGFATISRSTIDRLGQRTASESAKHDYVTDTSGIDTARGTLPYGFLAIDLARDLQLHLFDPDQRVAGSRLFRPIRIGSATTAGPDAWEHPLFGNGLLAAKDSLVDSRDASLIVAANGGSDLIYAPGGDAELVRRVASRVLDYDYVGGVFVDDKYGSVDGALPLSAINLVGSSKVPRPAIVVALRVFYFDSDNLLTAVQVSDGGQQQGQGIHGGFGRESTFNNMAAIGPDFKSGFVDRAPAGNGDIAPTVAHLIGADLPRGSLSGRVLSEALSSGPDARSPTLKYLRSAPSKGRQTILVYQEHDGVRYLDKACVVAPATSDGAACR